MALILTIVSVAALLFFVVFHRLQEKKKYQNVDYLNHLRQAAEFIVLIENLDDYLTWMERDGIKYKYSSAGKFFKNKTNYYKNQEIVKKFNSIFEDFNYYTIKYNQDYVRAQKEKLQLYFDHIEGKKLDDQQRTAVITDEYSNLIIAGAGSGKTLTIIGKVQYLLEQKNIQPDEILLLSFTKKTVDELNERLQKLDLDIQAATFHKLGYDLIKKFHAEIPAVTNENTLSGVIKEYLKTDILENVEALQSYIQYVACYMNIPDVLFQFSNRFKMRNLRTEAIHQHIHQRFIKRNRCWFLLFSLMNALLILDIWYSESTQLIG